MSQYEVGQILYMTSEKSLKIIPVQIVEEVIRTTISGKEKTYMLKFPDKAGTIVDINDISGNLFKDESSVEEHLIENTRSAIKKLLHNANSLKSEMFSKDSKKKEIVTQQEDDDMIRVDLGNGQIGKMKKIDLR